jgi:hypothetical protein
MVFGATLALERGMEHDDESLYRDGPIVRARTTEQVTTRAPARQRQREAVEKPTPVRQNRAAPPPSDETVELFVTRVSNQSYSWQVRRYGAIVVQEGRQTYPSAQLAREAGEAALGSL